WTPNSRKSAPRSARYLFRGPVTGPTVARPGMTSCPRLFHDPGGGVAGAWWRRRTAEGTGPLVGLFVTWVPGVDARSDDPPVSVSRRLRTEQGDTTLCRVLRR